MSILDEQLRQASQTATSTEVEVPQTSFTRTITSLVEEAGVVRTRVRILRDEVDELHENASQLHVSAFETELAQATAEEAKRGTQRLLELLGDAGFSWREVARLVGVSVPAVHKWRAGGGSVPEHRRALARLVALCNLLSNRFLIDDVATWLEMPLISGIPVTGLDLLAENRVDLLLRWAAHADANPEDILDGFDPTWRERYRSQYEVFTAPDGLPGIRLRG
jgi:transcriptional regulator with XRE-family HTH domain